MKIGVLTFHFAYNYGAMLQAYALSNYIDGISGMECEVIDYRPNKINSLYRPKMIDFYKKPLLNIKRSIKKRISCTSHANFEKFLKQQLKQSKRAVNDKEFSTIIKKYDAVFVGSDQVWNPQITGGDKNYLLYKGSNSLKKFSYAASIGANSINEEWKNSISKFLKSFKEISVREESGRKLLKDIQPELCVDVISDPVFLLSTEEWRKLEKAVPRVDKFILFYSLSRNIELEQETKRLSEKMGIKIVSIHPLFKSKVGECKCDIGPLQFLWLIDNAEYVCTDSFHATAFSVIFRKNIIVEYDNEKGNRIANLLNEFGVDVWMNTEKCGKYKFEDIDNKLKKLEHNGREFIIRCIGE